LYCRAIVDSAGRRSRADGKPSSSEAMADVVGAVGTVCQIEAPLLTVHHTVDAAPALPPRAPIHHRPPSTPSCRRSRSRSPNVSSSSSVVSPAAAEKSPIPPRQDSLDVFIPSSGDARPVDDAAYVTVHAVNKTIAERKPSAFESVESDQSAVRSVAADDQEFSGRDGLDVVIAAEDGSGDRNSPTLRGLESSDQEFSGGGGLDVVIAVEDGAGDRNLPTLKGLESRQTAFPFPGVSADRDVGDISGDGGRQFGRRTRPHIVRRLTRKETTKLSRKLTRKMSCRQQHALMMESEFDECDELDVVVEGDNDDNDDDDDIERSLAGSACQQQIVDGDGELKRVRDSDISDAGFEERITTRLHYDRLQVRFLPRDAMLARY